MTQQAVQTRTTATGSSRPRHTAAHAAPRRPRASIKSWVLGVAGTAGALVLLTTIATWMFGLTIVVLQTGSMAPTMPAGTAALIRTVPAQQLTIGDVVTVQRTTERMPVTHRVIGIDAVGDVRPGGAAGAVSLRLQGDANAVPDFDPYLVDEVGLVIFSVPEVGFIMQTLRTPAVLGLATLGVAGLIVWAFWPVREEQS